MYCIAYGGEFLRMLRTPVQKLLECVSEQINVLTYDFSDLLFVGESSLPFVGWRTSSIASGRDRSYEQCIRGTTTMPQSLAPPRGAER